MLLFEYVAGQVTNAFDVVLAIAEAALGINRFGSGIDLLEFDTHVGEEHVPAFAHTVGEVGAAGVDIAARRPCGAIDEVHAEELASLDLAIVLVEPRQIGVGAAGRIEDPGIVDVTAADAAWIIAIVCWRG